VSGAVSVTATASDNVAVARVEYWLDGTLQSTDLTSPFSWGWHSLTASNGAHTLQTKAFDVAGNYGDSAIISVTVNNTSAGTDISNWRIVQANSARTFYLPVGTVIPDSGYVVIGRNATKAAFEAFWGRTLPGNAIYINSGDTLPVINGSENYTLYNANLKVDGPSISMDSSAGQSIQRKDPCQAPGISDCWNVLASTAGTPGSGAGPGCGKGIVINEFSDALGTGNYIYEFVELYNDR
jgi:Bacterial Ig domain